MKHFAVFLLAVLMAGCATTDGETIVSSLYEIEVRDIAGEPVQMESFRNKTLLVVNTASKCGFTGQYDGLETLYKKYADKGFVVLGFPSNDFLKQEPGTNEEIASFCRLNYGVSFPMFEKISVKGKDQHPLYAWLTSGKSDPEFKGKITWNFNKFLVSGEGKVIARFGSRTKPDDPALVEAVEKALKK